MTVPRHIVTPGGVGDVDPHEHDATEISGAFNFLRVLKGLIDGDLTVAGFIRSTEFDPNTPGGGGWQIAGAGELTVLGEFNVGSNAVSAIQFIRANDGHLSFVEIDAVTTDVFNIDVAGGVMRIRFLDLDAETTAEAVTVNQDGTVEFPQGVNADTAHVIKVAGTEVARFTADGISSGRGEVGYDEQTTGADTNISTRQNLDCAVTVTCDSSRVYEVIGKAQFNADDAGEGRLEVTVDGGSTHERLATFEFAAINDTIYVEGTRRFTGLSGSTTFQLEALKGSGTMDQQVTTTVPTYVWVKDVGAA